ncbi:MAG: hypothetical protein IAB93_06860 [Bacteroidetes bacterium]|uniref:DUF3108 domain-containing protein n=1 Tax=Candidatus Merdivivens pullistercoris TaxID=2840873 RepID=A0A9D9I4F6_9BACT|nr:hypothetical protein [Candidatus Merdivivens pullistercoris]
MKRLITIIALLAPALLFAQGKMEKAPVAQEEGTVLEYMTTDKDGKTNLTKQEVISVKDEGGKRIVRIKDLSLTPEETEGIPQELYDNIGTMTYGITENMWYIDLIGYISNMLKASMTVIENEAGVDEMPEDFDFNVDIGESENPVFPISMKPGDALSLKPIKIKIKISIISMSSEITFDRYECTGRETVTVPAGTFDTYIIEEEITNKAKAFGISNKEKEYSKTWYAPGIGNVKSQTLDKKGRVVSESVLNSITKK